MVYKIRAIQPVAVTYNATGVAQSVRIAVLTLKVEYAYRFDMYPNTFNVKTTEHMLKVGNGKRKAWKLCLSKVAAGEEILYFSIARLKLTDAKPSVTIFDIDIEQPKSQYEKQLLRCCFHCWPERTLKGLCGITRILSDGRVLQPQIYQCITNIETYVQAAEARQAGKTVQLYYERIEYPEPYKWYLDYTGSLHSWVNGQHLPLSEKVHAEMERREKLQTLGVLNLNMPELGAEMRQAQSNVCYFGNVWLNQAGRFCLTHLFPIAEGDEYATDDYVRGAVELQQRCELLGQENLKVSQYSAYSRHHHMTVGRLDGVVDAPGIITVPPSVRILKLAVNAPVRIRGHENVLAYTVECRNKAVAQVEGIADVQECQVISEASIPQPNGDPIWLPETVNVARRAEALGFSTVDVSIEQGQFIASTWNTSSRFFATNNCNIRFGKQLYDNIVFNAAEVNSISLGQERKQLSVMLRTQGEVSEQAYFNARIFFSANEEQWCLLNIHDAVSNIEYSVNNTAEDKRAVKHTTINLLRCTDKRFKTTVRIVPGSGRHDIRVMGKPLDLVQCGADAHVDDCSGYTEIHYMDKVNITVYTLILWSIVKQFPWQVHIYFHAGLGRVEPRLGNVEQRLLRNKDKVNRELFVDKSVIIHVPKGTKSMLLGASVKHASVYIRRSKYIKNTAEDSSALLSVLQQVIVDDI